MSIRARQLRSLLHLNPRGITRAFSNIVPP
jgi:hypothetical protein